MGTTRIPHPRPADFTLPLVLREVTPGPAADALVTFAHDASGVRLTLPRDLWWHRFGAAPLIEVSIEGVRR